HALDVPFAMRGVATSSGARWDAEHSAFVFRGDALPAGLAPFRSLPYSLERRVERLLNADGAHDAAPAPDASTNVMVPRPHQLEAVRAIEASVRAGRTGFLLADDVGLGKTITAWEAVRRISKARA